MTFASIEIESGKQIITTNHTDILCCQPRDVSALAPCTHEEADTRMLLHLQDAVNLVYTKASIRTVNTDVLALAVTAAHRLNINGLWIAFGVGNNFHYIPAHEIVKALGPNRCIALPMFHAFTGCDTVSSFGGRGKRTAWDTWKAYYDVTAAFCALVATLVPMDYGGMDEAFGEVCSTQFYSCMIAQAVRQQ